MAAREEDIIKAFTNTSNILDASLSGYHCVTGIFGDDVEFYDGGFCVTVPMKKDNEASFSKCLRIWHRNLSNMKERSNLVSQALRNSPLRHRYFVDYEYLDRALNVGGEEVPGIRMDWVAEPTTTLRKFLLGNPTAKQLKQLAENFYQMCEDMNGAGFAHGDLSSSNILVNPDMSLILIDYDSMYVPSMKNRFRQEIAGTNGYQHPERARGVMAASNNDYFSQQVIYVQLLAFALRPQLCSQVSDKELLFTTGDLANPQAFRSSAHYRTLSSIGDSEVQLYLDELAKAIGQPIDQVCSVCNIYRSEQSKPTQIMHRNKNYCPQCGTKYPYEHSAFCNQCQHPREVPKTW